MENNVSYRFLPAKTPLKDFPTPPGPLLMSTSAEHPPWMMAERLRRAMMQYDCKMMPWLENEENRNEFIRDPREAFIKVCAPSNETLDAMDALCDKWPAVETVAPDAPVAAMPLRGGSPALGSFMNGWDIIGAVRIEQLNKLLEVAVRKGVLPLEFSCEINISFHIFQLKGWLRGKFAPPKIVSGSGSQIGVEFKVTEGAITVNSHNASIAGMSVITLVELNKVSSTFEKQEIVHEFFLIFTEEAIKRIRVENIPEEAKQLAGDEILFKSLMESPDMMEAALVNAAKGMQCKLFQVDMKDIPEKVPYLMPKLIDYALLEDGTNPNKSTFVVLLQTTSASPGSIKIEDGIIPTGSTASVIVSNNIFMKDIMLPSIAPSLNTTASSFSVQGIAPNLVIQNISSFDYKKVEGRTPKITHARLQIKDGLLYLELDLTTNVSSGIDVIYNVRGSYRAGFSDKGGGVQELVLSEVSFSSDHHTDVAWWVYVAAAAAAAIALPVISIVGTVIVALIPTIIRAIVNSVAPDINSGVFANAVKLVKWNYADIVKIEQVNMPGDVQLSGTLPLIAG